MDQAQGETETDTTDTTDPDTTDLTPAEDPKPRFEVNGVQVCASTLAAMSGAVVASIFGVTGTVVGAAVGSIIATTGSALYGHGIRRTTEKLQQTQAAQLTQLVRRWPRPASPPAEAPEAPGLRERLARHRLGLLAGVALVFVVSLAAITLIELAGRQPIADLAGHHSSGGTSIGSLIGGDSDHDAPEDTPSTTTPPPSSGDDDAVTDDSTSTTEASTSTSTDSTPTTSDAPDAPDAPDAGD
jgi:hypothetical protein